MSAVQQYRDAALAVARDTGWDLDSTAADHGWSAIGIGPVGQHRDSDALARSNYAVILEDMRERFGDAVSDARFGHWAVGWVEEIIWDADREDVAAYVQQTREALDDYPVADEMHFSGLEYCEAVETIEACLRCSVERDGIEYELSTPEGWAADVFSAMFDAGVDTTPDGMRESDMIDAAFEAGLYRPEAS